MKEFSQRGAGSPAGDTRSLGHLGLMEAPDQGGQDMRTEWIVVITRTIQVGGHGGDEVTAMLPSVGLAELDAGDLGDGVPFVGRLQRAGEQVFLLQGLGSELGIDAGAAEEEEFADSEAASGIDDVVLDGEVPEEEVAREIAVGLDPSHLGGGEEDVFGTFGLKKPFDGSGVGQIEIHGAAAQQIGEALTLEFAPDGATGEAMVPGDVDFRFGTHQ